jgi:hypothetical protein
MNAILSFQSFFTELYSLMSFLLSNVLTVKA